VTQPDLVSLDEIRAAAQRLHGVIVHTPLVPFLAAEPARLLIKPESLQPIGSFKLRGAYNAIATLPDEARQCGVVAHSSGNHGYAVAYAAALLGVKAAVVVPENAPAVKADAIARAGAELVRVPPTMAARVAASNQIAQSRGYAEIPPFDDRRVIAGQGTIGLEIVEDCHGGQYPAAVLAPISGGGLISGIAAAVRALSPDTRIIGVEPELAADARDSLRRGTRVAWPAADVARTMADSLRVEQVGELPFAHIREYVDDIVTVTEEEMLAAVRRLALHARLVAEPGGSVAVAAALFRSAAELGTAAPGSAAPGTGNGPLVAVLSGGNIDPALLANVLSYNG
jgi:threo-3-hydroxy-L-aspartate ammonia-lyase